MLENASCFPHHSPKQGGVVIELNIDDNDVSSMIYRRCALIVNSCGHIRTIFIIKFVMLAML